LNPKFSETLKFAKVSQDGRETQSLPLRKIRNNLYVTDPVSFEERSMEVDIVTTGLNTIDGKSKIKFHNILNLPFIV
jgi:hypothetical protein